MEREGVTEPWDILQGTIFDLLSFFPFLGVVLILTHELSDIHAWCFGPNSHLANA
jgi:hypothetical protein